MLFKKSVVSKKCNKCAELSGCWAGQHGKDGNGCVCFSPKGKEKLIVINHPTVPPGEFR